MISVVFDSFHRYGKSSGVPSEEGLKLDAIATFHYLTKKRTDLSPFFIVFGRSLGGAVAIDFAVLFQNKASLLHSLYFSFLLSFISFSLSFFLFLSFSFIFLKSAL
jgi:fermentation-respiration switch protein FrsA (DUF1100 family)